MQSKTMYLLAAVVIVILVVAYIMYRKSHAASSSSSSMGGAAGSMTGSVPPLTLSNLTVSPNGVAGITFSAMPNGGSLPSNLSTLVGRNVNLMVPAWGPAPVTVSIASAQSTGNGGVVITTASTPPGIPPSGEYSGGVATIQ